MSITSQELQAIADRLAETEKHAFTPAQPPAGAPPPGAQGAPPPPAQGEPSPDQQLQMIVEALQQNPQILQQIQQDPQGAIPNVAAQLNVDPALLQQAIDMATQGAPAEVPAGAPPASAGPPPELEEIMNTMNGMANVISEMQQAITAIPDMQKTVRDLELKFAKQEGLVTAAITELKAAANAPV